MGIFSVKPVRPTATDIQEDDGALAFSTDSEKVGTATPVEGGNTAQHIANPELEKRVVRKLDWHVPPLVSVLCMSLHGTSTYPNEDCSERC